MSLLKFHKAAKTHERRIDSFEESITIFVDKFTGRELHGKLVAFFLMQLSESVDFCEKAVIVTGEEVL